MLSAPGAYSERNPWMRHFVPAAAAAANDSSAFAPHQHAQHVHGAPPPSDEEAPSLFSSYPPNPNPNKPATLAPTLHKLSRTKKKVPSDNSLHLGDAHHASGPTSQLKALQKKYRATKRLSEPHLDSSGRAPSAGEHLAPTMSLDGSLNEGMRSLSISRMIGSGSGATTPIMSPGSTPDSPSPIEHELQQQNLYKTELCRSFVETGTCRYGLKCQFAHGKAELRPVMRHPKYKTEMCKTWATAGTCPYGTRCRFIHPKGDLNAHTPLQVPSTTTSSPLPEDDFGSGFVEMAHKIVEHTTSEEDPPRPLSNSGSRLSIFTEIVKNPPSASTASAAGSGSGSGSRSPPYVRPARTDGN